jgi:hypothetical protein
MLGGMDMASGRIYFRKQKQHTALWQGLLDADSLAMLPTSTPVNDCHAINVGTAGRVAFTSFLHLPVPPHCHPYVQLEHRFLSLSLT